MNTIKYSLLVFSSSFFKENYNTHTQSYFVTVLLFPFYLCWSSFSLDFVTISIRLQFSTPHVNTHSNDWLMFLFFFNFVLSSAIYLLNFRLWNISMLFFIFESESNAISFVCYVESKDVQRIENWIKASKSNIIN